MSVTVRYGPYSDTNAWIGNTVDELRRYFGPSWGIPADAAAYMSTAHGWQMLPEVTVVRDGSYVEFGYPPLTAEEEAELRRSLVELSWWLHSHPPTRITCTEWFCVYDSGMGSWGSWIETSMLTT